MARPRTIWVSPLVALMSTGFALAIAQERGNDGGPARPDQAAQAPQQPSMDMDNLLLLWEGQSKKLQTLEVAIYRIDKDAAWAEEEHYLGRAAFKTPQLAFLDFRKVKLQSQADPKAKDKKVLVPVKKDSKIVSNPYETIVCAADEVWHYRYDVKQIFIYPLDKNQRKRALEEGPLPFLFNMRAAEARQRYAMVLQHEDEKIYTVMIKPRLPEDQESFSIAWINLDKNFLLPLRIYLLAPDKKSSKDFKLSQIQPNKEVKANLFIGVDPGKPWKVERNPGGAPVPAAGNARKPGRQAVGKAAQRPAAPGVDQPR
jgi:TIGR03009 family protein